MVRETCRCGPTDSPSGRTFSSRRLGIRATRRFKPRRTMGRPHSTRPDLPEYGTAHWGRFQCDIDGRRLAE